MLGASKQRAMAPRDDTNAALNLCRLRSTNTQTLAPVAVNPINMLVAPADILASPAAGNQLAPSQAQSAFKPLQPSQSSVYSQRVLSSLLHLEDTRRNVMDY